MCNRMCDTVLFFLYAHLENKIITSNPPPPPTHIPHTHCHQESVQWWQKGPLLPPPPSLEFEVQNNKS